MRFIRLAVRPLIMLLGLLAGCNPPNFVGMYGVTPDYGVPPPAGDPTVEITDFTYAPASPVTAGEGIVFTVQVNKSFFNNWSSFIEVHIGDAAHPIPGAEGGTLSIILDDRGVLYDEIAGDLVYSAGLEWRTDYGLAEGLPVIARLDWWDDTPDVIIAGESLTVIQGGT